MTTILIGGDVCPIGRNEHLFRQGAATQIFNNLLLEFEQADFSLVNLECPLIEQQSPIEKDGPPLGAPSECINGFVAAGINAVTLANNHILDHGETGLRNTLDVCSKAGVKYFGAGANLSEASEVMIREINGYRVAFSGIAEHEFSIAGACSWGANPLDIIENVKRIRQAKSESDFLIVLLHGGRENYRYPSPNLQKICRFFVEEGADAVICQHTHCIGCYEFYQNAPIVYGQGNLIFDALSPKKPSWHEGFLVKLTLDESGMCKPAWIPFVQSRGAPGARRMGSEEEQQFLDGLDRRSLEILVDGAVQKKWLDYCRSEKYVYASRIRGHNRLLRALNRRLHFSDWFYSNRTKLIQRNVVECEVHREALETLWRDPKTRF